MHMFGTYIGKKIQVSRCWVENDKKVAYFRRLISFGVFGKWYEIDFDTAEVLIQLDEEAQKYED